MLFYRGAFKGSVLSFSEVCLCNPYTLVNTSDGDSWPTPSVELGTADCYFTIVCPD